jgi:transketolase
MEMPRTLSPEELDLLCINTIRFLSIDMVEKAKSGHPGAPMGMAAMAYTLWTRHLKFDPTDPQWLDRDRFVLSNGHASAMLYSLLHLAGYDLSLEDLKQFRQWGSKTPGHPEFGLTPGVEVTTGPLGQGFANAVGMAIAEQYLASYFNRPGSTVIDHHTYVFLGDGCMEEGVTSEAASLAGHLELGKLIAFYDDNEISIDGPTNIAFTEDVNARFAAYRWHVIDVADGNDVEALDKAIRHAKSVTDQPSLIVCHTHIGFGSPNKQGTAKAHGSPLGGDEVAKTREHLHWPYTSFDIQAEVLEVFREAAVYSRHDEWNDLCNEYEKAHPALASELYQAISHELPNGWDTAIPSWTHEDKPIATRNAAGIVMNAIAKFVPTLIGGSADLNESTFTKLEHYPDFEPDALKGGNYTGRTINYGVREHAMGAVVNGMAAHGAIYPFGSTFFTFLDYMREPVRLAALMNIPSLFIWTHDSVGLGEDGPTHQPIEHLAMLRATPNFTVIRPSDANETAEAWKYMMTATGPVGLVLSRQKLPVIDRSRYSPATLLNKGAYTISEAMSAPEVILIATGSEVSLALDAQRLLEEIGIMTAVVSMPSWELFARQSDFYREQILPAGVPKLSIELGSTMGWDRWVGENGACLGIDHFGASAPYERILEEYGFTAENIVIVAKKLIKDPHGLRRMLRERHQHFTHGHIASAPAKGSEGHS